MVFQFFRFGFIQFRFSRYVGVTHIDRTIGNLFQTRARTAGIQGDRYVFIRRLEFFSCIFDQRQQRRRTRTGNTAGNSRTFPGICFLLTSAAGSPNGHSSS